MGCASSKKRTTSVDDLTGGAADKKEGVSSSSKKNGLQVTSNDAKHKGAGGAGDAIQIPGAHTSFMAPDGIPFIDEDVEEDATTTTKPDVNRNVVHPETQPTVQPPAETDRPMSAAKSEEDQKKEEIRAEIMKREMEMTQNTSGDNAPAPAAVRTSGSETVQVVTTTTTTSSETHTAVVNGLEPASEEEQQRAAVKIQAGIRGYRDRQRIKALRASHSPHAETSVPVLTNGEEAVAVDGPAIIVEHEHAQVEDEHSDTEHSAEMDRAAVKIQASYKGYKTRKQLGKI